MYILLNVYWQLIAFKLSILFLSFYAFLFLYLFVFYTFISLFIDLFIYLFAYRLISLSIIAEPPSALGAPALVGTAGLTDMSMKWTSSATAGVPEEKYTLFCMASTATVCNYANKVGTSGAVDVARTVTTGQVSGLVENTSYKCCVMAQSSAATVYSTLASFTTSRKCTLSMLCENNIEGLGFLTLLCHLCLGGYTIY